ncbi:MAG TPA: LacI family DNA-binding transcriptional regulator [Terriglobales bacterium]|nr:LacI family DNA-binding transcriptional regulator [Terriglobales bacterium]
MHDVAKLAGVSVATVSRVANEKDGVSSDIEKRVKRAADELGVELARTNKPKIIAFILSNRDMLHPFHSRILVGAQNHCAARGWDMLFLSYQYDTSAAWDQLNLPLILERRDVVRAAILAGTNSNGFLTALTQQNIPFSVFGNNVVGEWQPEKQDVVWTDDIQGAYEGTRHLIALGHRDIWFVGNCEFPWFERCYSGYRRAMEGAGLAARLSGLHSGQDLEIGYLATKSILARRDSVSAIFAGTDATAIGVYKALKDCEVRIPEDISVIGQNDTEADALHPSLTTAREFPERLGNYLAELALNRIADPGLSPQTFTIPTELVKRESSRIYVPGPAAREKEGSHPPAPHGG